MDLGVLADLRKRITLITFHVHWDGTAGFTEMKQSRAGYDAHDNEFSRRPESVVERGFAREGKFTQHLRPAVG